MPEISVIIPVYNMAKYLRYCLDSLANQTFTDWEALCVDDGSKDNSLSILNEYAAKDDRFKVISQANQGPAAARNNGLAQAAGTYVIFLDPDDAYPSADTLFLLYSAARSSGADICAGSLTGFVEAGAPQMDFQALSYSKEGFVSFAEDQRHHVFTKYFFSKKFLDENNLRFPDYRVYEDPPFLVKSLMCAGKFYAIPQPVYWYRIRPAHVTYTPDKILCLVNGGCDIIQMSYGKAEYQTLHRKYVNDFLGDFSEANATGTLALQQILADDQMVIQRLFDTSLNCNGDRLLPPLQKILGNISPSKLPQKFFSSPAWQRKKRIFKFKSKVRGFFICLKENGLVYTIKHLLGK